MDHVSFSYEEGGPPAVRDVTLSVPRGAFHAILGQNGSGKSTLAKLINGLYVPTEGKVTVCGMDTQDEDNTWEIRRRAGMVFQTPDNQLVATVVNEDVAFGLENIGVPTEEMPGRIEKALRDVGMLEYADRAPHTLSGGQKQRVALVRALCMHPEVMLFDEVTAALGPEMVREVLDVILELAASGMTMIIVTHEMQFARAIADKVLFLEKGRVVEESDPEVFFTNPQSQRAREFLNTFTFEKQHHEHA